MTISLDKVGQIAVDVGGVRLMLDGPASEQAGSGSVIYYQVADLEAADPDGNLLALMSEVRP